ncbi:hypothetical protein P780_09545 [Vibrio mimicus CAIM 1882]|nr:hypothetical protein P780_09545 [Vibrio mimicus CAIM 1882]
MTISLGFIAATFIVDFHHTKVALQETKKPSIKLGFHKDPVSLQKHEGEA